MNTVTLNNKEYEYFYTSEEGNRFYTPKEVVHGGEPWLILTKEGELFYLMNGLWSRCNDEYEMR